MCDSSTQEQQSTGTQAQNTQQGQTTTYTASPQEQEMQQLQLANYKEMNPFQQALQKQGYGFINQLLAGSSSLPGFFGSMGQGISPQMTSDISQRAIQDLLPSFQRSGILDSGVAASIAGRTAGDIGRASAEYNLQNKLQLLNLALSGTTQLQQPSLQQASNLSQSLAGLRSINQTGNTTGNMFGNTSGFGTTNNSSLAGYGAAATGAGGAMIGASYLWPLLAASSKRYKKNIKLWK